LFIATVDWISIRRLHKVFGRRRGANEQQKWQIVSSRVIQAEYSEIKVMKFDAIVHEAEEGGYWAEVPSVPGCVSQGETMDELIANLREAINGCLSAPVPDERRAEGLVLEIAV